MNAIQHKPLRQGLARRRLVLGGLAAGATATLGACGGGSELFVPFFFFTFDGTAPGGQSVSFFLDTGVASGCTASGQFVAGSGVTVTVGVDNNRFDVAGTFNGRRLDITIAAPPASLAAAYSGEFVSEDTVRLTPVGAGTAFTITRTGPRAASCPA